MIADNDSSSIEITENTHNDNHIQHDRIGDLRTAGFDRTQLLVDCDSEF